MMSVNVPIYEIYCELELAVCLCFICAVHSTSRKHWDIPSIYMIDIEWIVKSFKNVMSSYCLIVWLLEAGY